MAYQGNLLSKTLVIGIIFLFIFMSITPSVAVDTVKKPSMPIYKGKTLYVGGTGEGNYTKIEDAIDNASDGDTVFVYDESSPYYENVRVDKCINLIGEDKNNTVIEAFGHGTVVYISADGVTVRGFTITATSSPFGIRLRSSYHCTITGNIILNTGTGISLDDSDRNTISNNIISNNEIGIDFYHSDLNIIMNNTISLNEDFGILLSGRFNIIKSNNIKSNKYGIYLIGGLLVGDEFVFGNLILKNNIFDNEKDAYFATCRTFRTNRWRHNYWNQSKIQPKLIFGERGIVIGVSFLLWPLVEWIPWFPQIDWFPTFRPYDIEV